MAFFSLKLSFTVKESIFKKAFLSLPHLEHHLFNLSIIDF